MSKRPTNSPLFATDATISSGPEVGLTTRLSPGAGVLAQGIHAGRLLPGRVLSYMFGTLGDWVDYIDGRQGHAAFKFTRTAHTFTGLSRLTAVPQTGGVGAPANRQKSIMLSGASGGVAVATIVNDGTTPPAATSSIAGAAPNSAPASDSTGTFFVGISGGSVVKSSDGGATTSTVTVTGLSVEASWVGFTSAHYLVFEAATGKMYKATSLAGPWTSVTLSATTVHDLSTDGAGTWVINCTNTTSQRAYYSTDDGVTWTLGSTFGTAGSSGGCYSDEFALFVVITSIGTIWISGNGSAWALYATVAGLSGLTFGQNTVAACGPTIACLANRPINSINKYPTGVAYSLDFGAHWNEVYPGSSANQPFTALLSANGRLYASDGVALFQSGAMVAPPSLFIGV